MLSAVRHAVARPALLALLIGALLFQPFGATALWSLPAVMAQVPLPDPTLLPVATILQVPLTVAYNALNVPAKPAGGWYLDPTTLVKIYKLTSATFPTSGFNWGHAYSEGGDEVSLPHTGSTRTIHLFTNNGSHWLIDFTPGVGVSNPRQLTGTLAPWIDLAFTFSNNPATPYYAYVANGYPVTTIRRFDIRTMTEVPGGGWPVTGEDQACWLHQSENDAFFVWMRGANGSTVVGYEPSTGTKKTYTNANLNEPRIDRGGRYVGISMNTPQNGLVVWDWLLNTVTWTTDGTIPFAHNASLKRRWITVDWNMTYPPSYSMFTADVPNSTTHIGGPANATLVHCNGNWIQSPANLNDQWAMCTHYGSLRPPETYWLAPGGMVLFTPNGQRRLLGHPYNSTGNYTFFSFAKFSPDGSYVLFTSDMNGSGRSDVFLAELPTSGSADTIPPTVALTAPAPGATVSASAVPVTASASDNVGVAGVQFKLDGATLGAEDTSAPFAISWNTTLASNGPHTLTAVARDAAGNTATSAAVNVTVANIDTTPPVLSSINVSSIGSTSAAITWTTNEPSDSQVEYGLTTGYGSVTPIDTGLVTAHVATLSGLAPSTLYHYRVKSRDAAGNLAVSSDFTFTTLASAPPTGLVGYWKLDDGTGTTAIDSSGTGNPGSLVNAPIWTTGQLGGALTFDGVSQYVTIPSTASLNVYPLTVAVWIKTTSTSGVRGLVNKYVAGSLNGWGLFLNNGNLCAWYLRDGNNYVYPGGGCPFNLSGYNNGQWHHLAYVVDAAGGHLYVDGLLKGSILWTGTAGAPTTTQSVDLGRYPGAFGGAEYFAGSLDDASVYNGALSADEILALYNLAPPGADITPPTVALTAPAAGASVSGSLTVSATASDNVGVVGVQFKLDSTNLGAEVTVAPFTVAWNTTAVPNGSHTLTAVARDAAGNTATSAAVSVTVNNDLTPPVLSGVTASSIGPDTGAITWATDELSDSQVEYGLTISYGSATPVVVAMVTAHAVTLNGLAAATLYHYRVKSKDAAGNPAVSSDFVFTTAPPPDTTPPTVSMTAPAANSSVSGTITVAAAASDNVGVAGVQFKLDNGNLGSELTVGPYTLAWNTTGVPNGSHTLTAVARDAAGNTATSAAVSVTVNNDLTPPVLSGVTVSSIGPDTAAISWATDELSDSQVEYGTTASYGSASVLDPSLVTAHARTLSGLTAATVYHYRVRSRDAAGNLAVSGDFTFATLPPPDTTPPTVSMTAPAANSSVSGTVTVAAAASDNVGVAGVQFKLDNGNLGSELTVGPYTLAWNTTGVPNGSHTLTAVARDAAGNTATSAAISVTVNNDLTPPVLSSVTASSIGPDTATITWETNEPSTSRVEYGPTMSYGSLTPLDSGLVTAHSVALSALTPGTLYHYRVRSSDAAGNLAVSGDFTFLTLPPPDTTPPTVSITAPAANNSVSGTVTVAAAASDNVGVAGVQFKLDGANLGVETTTTSYAATWNTTTVANGTHTLTAVARDAAGNVAASAPVSVTVTNAVDTLPPSIPVGVTATAVSSSQINLAWMPSFDNVGVAGYKIFRNGAQVATSSGAAYQDTGLSPATLYKYTIAAFDAAGNTSMQSAPATATTLAALAPSPFRGALAAVPGQIEAYTDGAPVTGSVAVPNTGSWSSFQWVGAGGIPLVTSRHVLRIWADQEYFNLDALRIMAG